MNEEESNQKSDERQLSRRDLLKVAAPALIAPVVLGAASGETAAQNARSNGKAALVTGSSRGIGAAVAKRLARDGFKVTVNCVVNKDAAAGVVNEIKAAGGEAVWEQADVSDPRQVRRLFDVTQRNFGGVDVVVSNAGISRTGPLKDMKDEDFNRLIDVNLKGGFYVLREAAGRVRDDGRIVSVSSSVTQSRQPNFGAYGATKAALEIFISTLAKELKGRNISVNAIAPGPVNTDLFRNGKTPQEIAEIAQRVSLGRIGEPSDIAAMISALVGSDGYWVNGHTVHVTGGVV